MYTLFLPDAAATEQLGARLAAALHGERDAVLLLEGDLGAGKTTLARGFLRQLGVDGPIASPTYAIVHSYPVAGAAHADVYRVQTAEELEQTGMLDGLDRGLWLVEWASRFPDAWPEDHLEVFLGAGEGSRTAAIRATGPLARAVLARMAP